MTLLRPLLCGFALSALGCLTPVGDTTLGVFDGGSTDGGRDAGVSVNDAGLPSSDAGSPGDGGVLVPQSCGVNQWCWEHALPQGQPLHAVFVVSPTEAWAGGDYGALLHFTDGGWDALAPVTDYSFQSLWAPSATELWAIGTKRLNFTDTEWRVFHSDGTTLRPVDHGPDLYVTELTGSSASNVWLLTGPRSTNFPNTLQRWNGTAFVAAPALPAGDLEPESVCVRSETEAWVTVSDSLNSFPIALYKWDGATWSLVHRLTQGSSRRFNSKVACPEDGVAVAQVFDFNTGTYSTLEVRNGQVSFGASAPSGVFVRTPHGELFAFAGAQASKWTSTGWQSRFTLAAGDSVYGVGFDFLPGTTLGWLANGSPTLSSWVVPGGFVPSAPPLPPMGTTVHVRSLNPTDPIAAFGSGTWGRRTSLGWRFFETPMVGGGARLGVVDAYVLEGGSAWVVGNGIARYDIGTALTLETQLPQPIGFDDIDGSDDANVWAVGPHRTVARLVGDHWELLAAQVPLQLGSSTSLSDVDLTAVDVRSANDVVVLGNDPAGGAFASVFYKWDGTSWSVLTWQFGTTLTRFARDPAGTLYAVEGDQVKKRAVGASDWTTFATVPGSVTRLRVYGVDEVEVVVRTETGLGLYLWDSDRMAFSLAGRELRFDAALNIVHGTPTASGRGTYWAVGGYGGVLRYESN